MRVSRSSGWAKRYYFFSALLVIFAVLVQRSHASAVFKETYLILNGGPQAGDYYYEGLDAGGGNVTINSINGSINLLSGTLTLKGGEVKTTMSGGDYQNGNNWMKMYYRFYDQTESVPSWSEQSISFLQENPYPENLFRTSNASTNLLSGNDSGVYKLDVYWDGNASYFSGGQQYFDMNQTSTYTATFTLFYGATTTATQGSAFTGTGYFNFNGSGQTYTLNSSSNNYTGETQIQAGTVLLSGSGTVASSSVVKIAASSIFDISGVTASSTTVKGVSEYGSDNGGSVKLGSKKLIINGGSGTQYLNVLGISGDTGSFELNDADTTLSLYGNSLYTGATTLTAGTLTTSGTMASTSFTLSGGNLTISADNRLDNSASVTVNSGTFTANGSDTIGILSGTGGTVSIGSGKSLTTTTTGTQSYSGVISGAGSLIKDGAGTLTLSGSSANTFSGTTTVNAGVLVLQKDAGVNALAGTPTITGAGTILRLGAANQFAGDSTFLTITNGATFEMNNFNDTLAFQGNGTVDLGSGTLTMNPGSTDTFSGKITGSGGLIKANAGTQILSGAASDYTGTTTVNSGYIEIRSASALGASGANQGTTVNSGGQLRLNHTTGMTVAESISLNGLGVSGDQSGVLKNTGGANTISGAVTLAGGSRIQVTAGSLNLSGSVSAGANSLYLGGTQALTISGNLSGTKTTGDMAVLIDNTGTTTFSGADNTGLTGNVRVNANGTVLLGSENALGGGVLTFAPSTVATIASTGGSARTLGNSTTYIYGTGLNLGVANTGTGSLTFGAVSLGNDATGSNQRTITTAAGSSHTFGAVAGGVNNTLIKSGSGTLILSGASSSTGGIQLNDGTLMVGNSSALGTGTLQIDYNSNTGSRTIASSGEGAFSLDNNVNLYFNALTLGQSSDGTGSLTIGSSGKTFALGSDGSALTRQITVNGEHTIASVITGGNNNKLGVGGSGRLTLTGPNTFSGGVSLNGTGQLRLNSATAAGTGSISQSDGNSTLEINTTGTVANQMSIYNVKTLQSVTLSGNKTLNNATYDVAADTTTTESGLLSGNGGVTKKGAGELILGNTANSFTNIVDIQNGTLSASTIANSNSTSTIGQGPEVKIGSASTAGTFKYTGGTAGMNRTVTVGSAGGTINVNDSAATMTLNGTVAGSGNTLTKTGAGTLAFGSGSSVSLGTIAVQQGTLLLGAANQVGASTDSASSLNLSAGTTVKTAFDLTGNVLTLAGSSAEANTIFDFNSGSGNDFTFGSTSWYGGNLKLSNVAVGTVINFGTFTGNAGLTFNDFQSKVSFTDTGLQAQINFSGTSLTVAAIPEPKVYIAACSLALLIGYAEVRRRKRAKSVV